MEIQEELSVSTDVNVITEEELKETLAFIDNIGEEVQNEETTETNEEQGIEDFNTSIIEELKNYENLNSKVEEITKEKAALMEKLKESNLELYEQIEQVEKQKSELDLQMGEIKQKVTPLFAKLIELDPEHDHKTKVLNKIQATYVFPTKKHSFDLKGFMEGEQKFYLDNITTFSQYSTISDVSAYTKFTVKKK